MKYKNELNVLTQGYLPLSYWKNWFKNIVRFFKNIKYAYQRITRGYADCDIWNIDWFLAQLLPSMLIKFGEITQSYPYNPDVSISSVEEWRDIINEIAEHFHNTLTWDDSIPINAKVMEAFNAMQEASHLENEDELEACQKAWFELEIEAGAFREEEKNKAYDMLKEWHFDLWD